jgi:hypothetical protein
MQASISISNNCRWCRWWVGAFLKIEIYTFSLLWQMGFSFARLLVCIFTIFYDLYCQLVKALQSFLLTFQFSKCVCPSPTTRTPDKLLL